ncbi:polysaccharide deacetylase family protein [Streptomyces sp. 6N223]|uniref:polysaccharide deacetylase family protein n=1 Tax=Streptomyces sp. 6N223 TaxID=3457412 RepID=UPI003FD24C3A
MRWATILAVACAAAGLQGVQPQVAATEGKGRENPHRAEPGAGEGGQQPLDEGARPAPRAAYGAQAPGRPERSALRPASGGGGRDAEPRTAHGREGSGWWPPVYALELPGLRPASGGGGDGRDEPRREEPGAGEEFGEGERWVPLAAPEPLTPDRPAPRPASGDDRESRRSAEPRAAHGPQVPDRPAGERRPAAAYRPEGPALPPVPYAVGALAAREPLAALPPPEAAGGAPAGRAGAAARTAASALAGYADRLARAEERRVVAAREWGLRRVPLLPPPPPEPGDRPRLTSEPGQISGSGLPPVITRVPTDDKVVFLTIDDGAEKDPRLLRMLRELEIPASGFLTDYVARDGYDYFRRARREGTRMHNHTVNHHEMPRLSYGEQREEICRQQRILEREIGERPTLFRPPYGAYDRDTLRAAANCGVRAVPLWAEEAFPDRIEWSSPDGSLHPGDIILTHFRGPDEWRGGGDMTDMLRRVLDTVTAQGFAVARLEDYIG